ncbi:superoxide dismutase [Tsuneonella sp. HG249]
MAFQVTPLPYADTALEPAISAKTLSYHHGKHHKAYIDKTNAAVAGTALADSDLEAVIAEARGSNGALFNNAAQSWNHGFYWHSLCESPAEVTGELAGKMEAAFGSFDDLKTQLKERGAGHFSNGWVWLLERGGRLEIGETHDGDTFADQDANPLLVVDLWEHAYYLDHQNLRPAYLAAVIDSKLNWEFAAENLARGTTWKYPA